MTHIITVGNEKGGAGKSTMAMHIATALARMGHRVVAMDFDFRQRSFARYLENRAAFNEKTRRGLPIAEVHQIADADKVDSVEAAIELLDSVITKLSASADFILNDCPGSHTPMSQAAHAKADTLVTPLNDSFIDFDLLARVAPDGKTVLGPSIYSEMVWAARQQRALKKQKPADWVVLRNRLGSQNMVNKKRVGGALENLAKRIGFRTAPGFSERVVFRELFPKGLTLLDLKDVGVSQLSVSNIAARQEVRDLIKALNLPGVTVNF